MASLKSGHLAAGGALCFRMASSGARYSDDTGHVSLPPEKKKYHKGKNGRRETIYTVTVTLPFGGSRCYALRTGGMTLAIQKCIGRDNRMRTLETHEAVQIEVKRLGDIEPPLKHNEVRLLLNTESPSGVPFPR